MMDYRPIILVIGILLSALALGMILLALAMIVTASVQGLRMTAERHANA